MRKTVAAATIVLAGVLSGIAGQHATQAATRTASASGSAIVQTALKYLGLPYAPRGTTPRTGFNDLAFVRYAYARSGITLHIGIARRAYKRLLTKGPRIAMADLQPGDVVFFKNTLWAGLSHVGIYVGDGKFVHAEWYHYGVTVTSFHNDATDGNYWAAHYQTANRPWAGT